MKQRWKDSLTEPPFPTGESRLAAAAVFIANGIVFLDPKSSELSPFTSEQYLAWAGWLIREERRECDAEYGPPSVRNNFAPPSYVSDERLLWRATNSVTEARMAAIDWRAYYLRAAEACLREYWKRQQAGAS